MMTRVLCLWIPNWPVQRRRMQRPELRERPLVLFAAGGRGGEVVVTCSRQAASLGVSIGMPVAEATSLCGDRHGRATPRFLPCDPAADREALQHLAWSCDRFSPVIGLEEADAPESLLFDLTGCGPLFGGEEQLAKQLQQHVARYGLHVRIALVDTIGAAWAVAHCGTRSKPIVSVPSDRMADVLRSLPVTALRLSPRILSQLCEFQLRRIDQLLALPRSSLPSRFGPELLRRIDQAFGRLAEAIIPERRPEPIEATWESEHPLQIAAALEAVVTQLLEAVLVRLQERGEGIQRLSVRLGAPERTIQTLSIECVRPTTDSAHLMELLQLRWERESFPDGLNRVQLTVLQSGRQTAAERFLWESGEVHEARNSNFGLRPSDFPRDLERLIERLSTRLGTEAVRRPVLVADVQPERAYGYEPCLCSTGFQPVREGDSDWTHGLKTRATTAALSRLTRPVWLQASPVAVEVMSVSVGGPPYWFRWRQREYTITRHWGPERITTGWWRGDYIRRDYFHVEAMEGERFWLFRDLLTGRWFLHAVCD